MHIYEVLWIAAFGRFSSEIPGLEDKDLPGSRGPTESWDMPCHH